MTALPTWVSPMLARSGRGMPVDLDERAIEPKWDGWSGAATVWSTSALVLRTGVVPRWFGWLGMLAGVVQLFAIFFLPALVFWVWVLLAGALLTSSRANAEPTAGTQR